MLVISRRRTPHASTRSENPFLFLRRDHKFLTFADSRNYASPFRHLFQKIFVL
ncbi:hypothetical protein Hanom_Chr15g01399461 [Helianthus anomalus]